MDVSNVIRWHKWKKRMRREKVQKRCLAAIFQRNKNVWNDLPDMIMLWRVKYWAIQENQKASRGKWGTVRFEIWGAIKICLLSYILRYMDILILNLLLVVRSLERNTLSICTLSLVNHRGSHMGNLLNFCLLTFYLLIYRFPLNLLHRSCLSPCYCFSMLWNRDGFEVSPQHWRMKVYCDRKVCLVSTTYNFLDFPINPSIRLTENLKLLLNHQKLSLLN